MRYNADKIMRWLLIILLMTLYVPLTFGEDIVTGEAVQLSFNRGLDFFKWGTVSAKNYSFRGEKFRSTGDFSIMLRQPPGFPNQWKTSVDFQALWTKPLAEKIQLQGDVNTYYFQDRQVSRRPFFMLNDLYPSTPLLSLNTPEITTGRDNKTFRQSVNLGLEIESFAGINFEPTAGIYGERVMESSAVGPSGKIDMDWYDKEIGGYSTVLNASSGGQFMEGRTHHEINADLSAAKTYSEGADNIFTAHYRNYLREFPNYNSLADRRKENEYRFGDILKYRIYDRIPTDLKIDISLSRRKVEPNISITSNHLEELSTSLNTVLEGTYKEHKFDFGFSSEGQNQTYGESQSVIQARKVNGRQYGLTAGVDFELAADSLRFDGKLSRFKYDVAPEIYSIDTRDELRHSYTMNHYHPLGGGLSISTLLRTDLYHLVYLKSARSGDNYWERYFLLSPTVRYSSTSWSQSARFKVSADYFDYDFQESAASNRVYRKYSAEDSLSIKLMRNLSLEIQYLFLLEDQGILDWGAFIQELSDEFHTQDGSVNFVWENVSTIYRIGWGYYRRKAFHVDSEGNLAPGEVVVSSGPLAGIRGEAPFNFQIELAGSYKWVTMTSQKSYPFSTIDLIIYKVF